MNTHVRKQLERASRVAKFARDYPSDDPGYAAALARLEERLARAAVLEKQFTGGALARKAAVAERDELRRSLTAGLQLLAGIARTAGKESIGAPIVIRYPGPRQNQHEFQSGARLAVETAREREELLVRYGLPADHLARLEEGLGGFARLLETRDEAWRSRVAARAELAAVTGEILSVVHQLHAINRYRFREDPAAQAAWANAADRRIGTRKLAAGPDGALPALPPGDSEVRPAA